jgi:type VI secretion system secreted protein VgrG
MAGSLAPSHISAWDHRYEFRSGKWAQKDYNFEDPTTNLMTSTPTLVPLAEAKKYEIYDYPGAYQTKEDGEPLSRLRMEEEEMRFHTVDAASTCRTFTAGGKFTLKRHTFAAETGKSYLITAIQPTARDDSYISRPSASPKEYANTFTCIPADAIFRPARITPKPVVAGPQTAVVVGPKGEEIWTDKYGRVKVQFHWDRYGQSDENSSCWVRVSHPWAGKKWGALATPRIGQEVIVDFLEGDPDQPIITGRVYNAVQMPPYDLNDQGGGATNTISGMKSASTPGSGGYNEMSMDDTKGKEKITIHGQYDMNTTVQHDKTTTVNNNRSTTVVVDDTLNVNSNRTVHVKGKLSETIDTGQEVTISSGYQETITGGATSTISGGLTSTVNGQWENTVSGHLRETVTAGEEQGVTGGKTLTVTGGFTEEVTGERWMTVTGPINQSATTTIDIHAIGAGTYTSDASLALAVAGSVVEITPDTITISAAGSTIKVDASGVSINGQKISLNC